MAAPSLNAEEIFDSAAKTDGLEEYADTGMRQRFACIVDTLNQNGPIADWALPAAVAQLSGLVRRRVELARDWSLYPQIDDEKIERPFVVLGSGRTGTSAMQSTARARRICCVHFFIFGIGPASQDVPVQTSRADSNPPVWRCFPLLQRIPQSVSDATPSRFGSRAACRSHLSSRVMP